MDMSPPTANTKSAKAMTSGETLLKYEDSALEDQTRPHRFGWAGGRYHRRRRAHQFFSRAISST